MDYILNFGGQDEKGYLNAVDVFKVKGNRVEKVAYEGLYLGTGRNYLAAASAGNYILAMGGYDGSNYSKAVDVFNVTNDRVVKVENHGLELSVARAYLSAASAGNYILAMGGYDGAKHSNAVDIFEVTNNRVTQVTDYVLELSVARNELAAASVGDYVLAMGGYYDEGSRSNAVDVFKVTDRGVEKVAYEELYLGTGRSHLAAAAAGNYILAMGGYDGSNYSKAVDVFEVTGNRVVKVENHGLELSVARNGLSAASVGNYILALGGYDGAKHSNAVDIFEVTSNGVVKVDDRVLELSVPCYDLAAASVGNYILAMGGYDGAKHSKAVDVFYNFD